jgi:hypothetical protein
VFRRPFAACLSAFALLALLSSSAAPAKALQDERITVVFDFVPSTAEYHPNQTFEILFTVKNNKANSTPYPDEIMVTNVSAYFSWMGPNERVSTSVLGQSIKLEHDEFQTFTLNVTIPADAEPRTYTYMLFVGFYDYTAWGIDYDNEWDSAASHNFIVTEETDNGGPGGGSVDYMPFLALIAIIVAVGIVGAVLWRRSGSKKASSAATAAAFGAAGASSSELPAIRTSPNEGFPVERGFVYLVKEKRPGISFAMFNEAVAHGAKGMVVTREHPNRLKQTHDFRAEKILWLTRRVGEDHVDPTELIRLSMNVSKFIEGNPKTVVLVEGLEYLITQNDFETVLRFVNHLHDFVLAHDCAVIIVLDPRVLSTRELALLERSARVVESGEFGVVKPDRLSDSIEAK